jgi:hypothetical protein
MAYRDDVTALSARHDALTAEVAQKTRELDESRRLLEQARARARLPVLDQIRVASPCSANWNQMTGDDRTRHCGACDKDVYNLSGMTREEAEALIIERNGELCVRYYQRSDGTIITSDCTIGVKRKRRRRVIAAGIALLASTTAAFVVAKRMRAHEQHATMGDIGPTDRVMMGGSGAPDRVIMGGSGAPTEAPPPPRPHPAPPPA